MAKLDFPSSDQSPWTNPDTGVTYVWKTSNGQGAWHIASAGDTDIFVAKAGDNMEGNLTFDGDKIELYLNETGSPALIKDPSDFDSIYVVMPMKG